MARASSLGALGMEWVFTSQKLQGAQGECGGGGREGCQGEVSISEGFHLPNEEVADCIRGTSPHSVALLGMIWGEGIGFIEV